MAKPPSVKARRSFNKGAKRGRGIAGLGGMLFGGIAGTIFGVFDGTREIMTELFPSEDEDDEDDEEEEGEGEQAAPPAPSPTPMVLQGVVVPQQTAQGVPVIQ